MDDLLQEFLAETNESLATLDVELVRFERESSDATILGNIFRLMHTIKGTCGFLGLPRLDAVAHAGENMLGKFRDGELAVTPRGRHPDPARHRPHPRAARRAGSRRRRAGRQRCRTDRRDQWSRRLGRRAGACGDRRGRDGSRAPGIRRWRLSGRRRTAGRSRPGPWSGSCPRPTAPELPAPPAPDRPAAKPRARETRARTSEPREAAAASSIRVNVDVIENLMTLISELVLTRNQLLQMQRAQKDSEFKVPLQRLSHITSDLQDGVTRMRMQPIGNAWNKLPRIVRDLAVETGKKIELVHARRRHRARPPGAGDDQGSADPYGAQLRRSRHRGRARRAWPPASRRPAPSPWTPITKAATSSSASPMTAAAWMWSVFASKAIANGLAPKPPAAGMSEQQILQFIFRAGFSTAEKVTSVSGRGVGMDVVRTNIERIGGTIELTSVAGRGTTFLIKIPLTLAIVSALIVETAGQRFAIPQLNVIELVGVSDRSDARIETINNAPVLRLRDRLLPLVSLRGAAGTGARQHSHATASSSSPRSAPRHVRHHRRPGVRHRGNRGQAGGADPARHALLCRQHHPG